MERGAVKRAGRRGLGCGRSWLGSPAAPELSPGAACVALSRGGVVVDKATGHRRDPLLIDESDRVGGTRGWAVAIGGDRAGRIFSRSSATVQPASAAAPGRAACAETP